MQTLILDVIDPFILLGIGVILIAVEVFMASFILIWFAIGFILTAVISWRYEFSDGIWQLATVAVISLLLLIILRKKMLEKVLKSDVEITDNYLKESGIGEIKNSKVFYKGTYWEIDSSLDEKEFKEGDKVKVLKTDKNFATIEK